LLEGFYRYGIIYLYYDFHNKNSKRVVFFTVNRTSRRESASSSNSGNTLIENFEKTRTFTQNESETETDSRRRHGKAQFLIGSSRDGDNHLNFGQEASDFREKARRSKTDSESSSVTIVDRKDLATFSKIIIDSSTLMRDPEEILECQSINIGAISANMDDIEGDWASENELIL
jgi:hypothetical protein